MNSLLEAQQSRNAWQWTQSGGRECSNSSTHVISFASMHLVIYEAIHKTGH